jgi:hypothetical protein
MGDRRRTNTGPASNSGRRSGTKLLWQARLAQAKEKKAAIEANQDVVATNGLNTVRQQLDAELKASSGSTKVMIEGEEKTLQAIQKHL